MRQPEERVSPVISAFSSSLRSFIESALRVLPPQIPMRPWKYFQRRTDGNVSVITTQRPEFSRLFSYKMSEQLWNTPEFVCICDIVRESPNTSLHVLLLDGAGKPVSEPRSQPWWLWNTLGLPFFIKYLEATREVAFEPSAFQATLNRLLDDLAAPELTLHRIFPLLNCKLSTDTVRLNDSTVIRQVTTSEVNNWLNDDGMYWSLSLDFHELMGLSCCIDMTYKCPRFKSINGSSWVQTAGRITDAIRLETGKRVVAAFSEEYSEHVFFGGRSRNSSSNPTRGHDAAAIIDAATATRICTLWDRVTSCYNAEKLQVSIRRWDYATDRATDEDKLIDYWIALESLFTPDSTAELRFRASIRIAAFLGASNEHRLLIYETLMKSYDMRSKVVHGGRYKHEELSKLTECTREYVRQAIMALIYMNEDFDPRSLEKRILTLLPA